METSEPLRKENPMKFNSMMHVSFYVNDLEKTLDFYCNKLGLKKKMEVRFSAYKDSLKPHMKKAALERPDDIFLVYVEVAPGQFLEFFPKTAIQKPHSEWNECIGYSHFALLVDDIFATQKQLEERGVAIDILPNIGPSKTWQMWVQDPDGNKFEIMQYTEGSLQVVGNC